MTTAATVLPDISTFTLSAGGHSSVEDGVCAMELVSFIAGEEFSDRPQCACPVLGAFLRNWNDSLPDDERNALILPLIPRLVGTRGSKALETRRATMAADWLVREHTPAWLRLAGLTAQADALSSLPEITDFAAAPAAAPAAEASLRAAFSAGIVWDAARDAVWDALKPTREALQQSALRLVERMIEAVE